MKDYLKSITTIKLSFVAMPGPKSTTSSEIHTFISFRC